MIARTRMEAVLNRIRLLQADLADIELVDVRPNGVVSVRLIGMGGCKTAPLSMHMGLDEVLREIPDFGELRLV
jgi:Fe-S cluster biogenesis protein NfuA